MTGNKWVRPTHRWLSMVFTAAVVIVTVVAVTQKEPAEWVFLLPVPPLLLLMASGLFLFVLPYAARRRERRTVGAS